VVSAMLWLHLNIGNNFLIIHAAYICVNTTDVMGFANCLDFEVTAR
jgi:hypothetical protein